MAVGPLKWREKWAGGWGEGKGARGNTATRRRTAKRGGRGWAGQWGVGRVRGRAGVGGEVW
eukprot:scaffold6122_cov184-Amphora_coffeaeformis.AAC.4